MKIYTQQEITKSRNSLSTGKHQQGDIQTCPLGIKWALTWVDVGTGMKLLWMTEPISII